MEFPVEGVKAFSVSGSPADCVRIGVLNLLPKKPDLVFSGINFGYNAGTDVMYSGTIGAAMEAVFQGIPSIALSEGTNEGYIITDLWLDKILSEVIGMRHGTDNIVNINFPTCKPEELKGILRNRFVSKSCIYKDTYICNTLPDGTKTYMINGEYQENAEDGSDLKALFDKYISIGTVNNIG